MPDTLKHSVQTQQKVIRVMQFICPTGYYGAERWVLAIARNFDRANVHCELVIPKESQQTHQLINEFSKLGFPAFSLPMRHAFDLSIIKSLAKLLNERQIDILHTHGYKSDIIGILAAKKAGINVVVTPHGFENTKDIKLRSYIWLGCQMMRFADKVAPLSKQLYRDVQKYGVNDKQLVYIQNGVDLSELDSQPTTSDTSEPKVKKPITIGFIGQLISRKNVEDILDIFASIHRQLPNTRLLLLGDGDQRTALEQYAKRLDCHPYIEFLGFKSNRLDYLKQFDLFVMTSSLEGIPRCLMEAMAMRIPVSAYNIAGIDQLIHHQKTGLLANYKDKDTLAQHWLTLLTDKPYAHSLAEHGRQFIEQHYSAQHMAQEYSRLFANLLKE